SCVAMLFSYQVHRATRPKLARPRVRRCSRALQGYVGDEACVEGRDRPDPHDMWMLTAATSNRRILEYLAGSSVVEICLGQGRDGPQADLVEGVLVGLGAVD